MLHFIPAWYQQNKWRESEQYWYSARTRTEFDDTVKHVQLFHRSKAYPFQIMLPSYAPNFRHFLHRQSVFHAPYWSVFDAIQEVRRRKVMMFSFHNLNWPENIEFIYSPYVIVAMLKGEKYAQIEFGEDGNMIQIDIYHNGQIQRRNIYDDRGFVSSTIVYEAGEMLHQDYLTDKGAWKLREHKNGLVEINPKNNRYYIENDGFGRYKEFKSLSYDNIGQVIVEVLNDYISHLDEKDIFCVAMHDLNMQILEKSLQGKKTILSFYEKRLSVTKHADKQHLFKHADYAIVDSSDVLKHIKKYSNNAIKNIVNITPFDSRVDFGISQQLNVQKIMVPVDDMEPERFDELIYNLGKYLLTNDNAQVHLFTRKAGFHRKGDLLNQAREALRKCGLEEDWASPFKKEISPADLVNEEKIVPVRFFVEQCVDELSVSKCIREQRIMVDMRSRVQLYLRITGISVGIPQIIFKETEFVEDGKNGMIIKDMSKLPEAIAFYLDSLNNWNESMVYSYELGKNYTTEVLVEKWKEVIEFVGIN